MILTNRTFERAARRLILREIRASEALRAEYARRSWQRLRAKLHTTTTIFAATVAMLGLPAFFSLVLLGPGIVIDEGPAAGQANPLRLALAFHALWMFGWLLAGIGTPMCDMADLKVLAHFPVSERNLLGRQMVRFGVGTSLIGVVAACIYCFTASQQQFSVLQWMLALLLAAIQWPAFVAGVLVFASFVPNRQWQFVGALSGLTLFLGSLLAALVGVRLNPWITESLLTACFLLPTGWLNGLFFYGVIGAHSTAVLFLLPVAISGRLAMRLLRQGISIKEVVFGEGGVVSAIPNDDLPAIRLGATLPGSPPAPSPSPLPAEVAEQRILTGNCLRPTDWSRLGWVQRVVYVCLESHQRDMVEFLYSSLPRWSKQWNIILYSTAIVSGFTLLAPINWGVISNPPALVALGMLLVLLPAHVDLNEQRAVASHCSKHLDIFFPLGLRELCGLTARVALVRCLLWIPITIGLSLAIGWKINMHPLHAALMGVVPLPLWLGGHLFGMCLSHSALTNDTSYLRLRIAWYFGFVVVVGLPVVTFLVPGALWSAMAALAMLLFCWFFWNFYHWAYHHLSIDIVHADGRDLMQRSFARR